jgi:hypothetical protein
LIARPLAALALSILALAAAPAAGAQESATRFEITAVADTTFSIRLGEHAGWVRRGLEGIAVDPRRRDLLIARFRVVDVKAGEGEAVALITGQTTLVETEHVALLTRPRAPWYRQRAFWVGLLLGGGIGAGAASL